MAERKATAEAIGISKVLRRHSIYVMFFGYVAGHRDAKPDATWNETAETFMKRYNLTAHDVEPESLIREAQRMTVDFMAHGI
jgi:hypothetical protein